jgi:hypothetical protein
MRLLLLLINVLGLNAQNLKAQNNLKMAEVIYKKMETVLENAGVLVPIDKEAKLDKWPKRANQAMRENFRREFIPLDDSYAGKSYKYLLPNWDLTYLGSTIFSENKFSPPPSLQIPLLPIVSNNKQFNINSGGKFNLFYSLTEFTNMAVNIDIDANAASFVHARLKSGIKYSKQDKKSFDISSGLFENQLAKIFNDAKTNTVLNKADFFPLYLIWQSYANKVLDPTKSYYAIKSINAVVWNRDEQSSFSSHTDVEAALKIETPILPFLRAKMSSNGQWGNEKTQRTEFSIYDLYLMEEPSMIEVVSPKQIQKLWTTLADDYNSEYGITLSPTGSNTIELAFGPVSDPLQHSTIRIDEDGFLKQFSATETQKKSNPNFVPLITSVKIQDDIHPDQNNSVRVKIKFTYNPKYFTGVATDLFNEAKQLTLLMGDSVGKMTLSKVYNITFNADAKMIPKIITASNEDEPTTNLNDGKYAWKFNVDYSYVPEQTEILPIDILKKNISFTHTQNKTLTSPGYLLKATCAKDPNIVTRFNCTVELKDPQNLLSASEDFLSGEMTLNSTVRFNGSIVPYTRKLPFVFRGIQPPKQINNDFVSLTTPAQVALFFNAQKTVNGKSYQDFLKENSDASNVVDYNKIGDLLIKAFNFTRDSNSGKYLVSSEYIDINKYLTQQQAK